MQWGIFSWGYHIVHVIKYATNDGNMNFISDGDDTSMESRQSFDRITDIRDSNRIRPTVRLDDGEPPARDARNNTL